MNFKTLASLTLMMGIFTLGLDLVQAQVPPPLILPAKLRDFREVATGKSPTPQNHPDFNNYSSCPGEGYVSAGIDTTGKEVTSVYANDKRNPKLVKTSNPSNTKCFTDILPSTSWFDLWFNDSDDPEVNRPFLTDIELKYNPANSLYEIDKNDFFPLDDANPGINYRSLPGKELLRPFGNIIAAPGKTHNYGFTMEFHTEFTYLASIDQKFTFTGDDDVWVYINGKLVIDIGGIHGQISRTVDLKTLGLVDFENYKLDFFFAERRVTDSHFKITTSLVLGKQKVSTPVPSPYIPVNGAHNFLSSVSVSLSVPEPDAKIYYTLEGNNPDTTDLNSLSKPNGKTFEYQSPIKLTSTTILKAIATKARSIPSDIMTANYRKTFTASTLEIFDANGDPLKYGFLTEKNSTYILKLATTQADLATITDEAKTKLGFDSERLTQGPPLEEAGKLIYRDTVPLSITASAIVGPSGNGKTDAITYDSLTVQWINPKDPTDIAERKVQIRPYPVQASAYFSKSADGTTPSETYDGNETTLYVFVTDQILPPGITPKIVLETTPVLGVGRTSDKLTLDLVAIAPGKYRALIPVEINPISKTSDLKLQLAVEDEIKATYTDPVDFVNPALPETPAVAKAGYGSAPENEGNLQFTEKNNNVLPGGIFYNPEEGKIYLTYSDDFAGGLIDSKSASITIVNTNGDKTAPADTETFNIILKRDISTGTRGIWRGELPLFDRSKIMPKNDTAETYVLGKITATVQSHNKAGGISTPVTDNLNVAFPDKGAEIKIEVPTRPGETITRKDSLLTITIIDQSLSSEKDTLYTTLTCSESGDKVNIVLIEDAPKSGIYISKIITKVEGDADGAKSIDEILQCKSRDNIKLTYVDPVYKGEKTYTALIDEPAVTKVYYTKSAQDVATIGSVSEYVDSSFTVVVEAYDPDINKKDLIQVTLTTPQGEAEKFMAMETGIATGKFTVRVPFGFISSKPTQDQKLQGQIIPQSIDNRVNATGSVTLNTGNASANILLIAAFNPVKKAYIKDVNGDGRGDRVYIEFERPLANLPGNLGAQWNDSISAPKTANKDNISYVLGMDSTVLVADYSNSQFGENLTAAKNGNSPKAFLPPNDALFIGQSPRIEDSIGPVIISATKIPANIKILGSKSPSYYHDTLLISLSEPLRAEKTFLDMLLVSLSCGDPTKTNEDYSNAKPLTIISDPEKDASGLKYTVIIDNSDGPAPQTGNCIFLNADSAKFTDNFRNSPPKHPVKLLGDDRPKILHLFRGYPPVAGLNANSPGFQAAVQDSREPQNKGFATPQDAGNSEWKVLWFEPWNYSSEGKPLAENRITNLRSLAEAVTNPLPLPGKENPQIEKELPLKASTIQVVTTAAYIAHVSIFDLYGNFVASSIQTFGAHGEMKNPNRVVNKGIVSYLYWDRRDKKGQLAGQGVYIWKVRFEFLGGKQEVQYTKTGILRNTDSEN